VGNFVDKVGLDSRKPSTGAAFNKLPVAQAVAVSRKIKDLRCNPVISQKK
jgi:hypothetical protein